VRQVSDRTRDEEVDLGKNNHIGRDREFKKRTTMKKVVGKVKVAKRDCRK
jgi:hypothetical protein